MIKNRAQLQMSFGMIFSIILAVVFLVFAFYAIRTFLNLGSSASAGKFISELRGDVEGVWKSTESSETQEYFLPSKISHVCFVDFSVSAKGIYSGFYTDLRRGYYGTENLVFYPFGSSGVESAEIKNINLEAITEENNPYCIENNGKINIVLSKDFGEALVRIR